jgi:dTDP-4-amino-4,6-dideoxygalactose transaminase
VSEDDRRSILKMIDDSLATGSLTLGPHTESFEQDMLEAHGGTYAVAVASGTAAIEIVLRTIGVDGRDVVVPTNTFFATAAAAAHAGGRPVLADVTAESMTLSVETVEAVLTPDTAAVVVVHIGGQVAPETLALRRLCDERGIALVEDAAHAHGASLGGRPAGTFGVAGTFSFYPTKVITSGEGGMILTADDRIRDDARIYRDQGKAGFLGGDHVRLGYAWRLSEVQAAIGSVQVRRLAEFVDIRSRVGRYYDAALDGVDGITPLRVPADGISNYYKYIALLDAGTDRDAFKAAMRERGVSCSGEVYAKPLHQQPVFQSLAVRPFPAADDVCARHICLPIHSDMTDAEADHVVSAVRDVLAG